MLRPRLLEMGVLALLAICVAQVLYWIIDQARYTERVQGRMLASFAADVRASNLLLERGVSAAELRRIFPHVAGPLWTAVPLGGAEQAGRMLLEPEAARALRTERHSRLNRYGWEGSFFLVVLLAGMGVLVRTLRRDADLRRRQQNFLAAVTHEFKSPLASLRLSAETLALRDPSAPKRSELVERMLADLARLENMVTSLLDTTRLEEGRLEHRPESIGLEPQVDQVLESFERQAEASGVSLEKALAAGLCVHADPVLVRTVIGNLVDNAVQSVAAAKGGVVRVEGLRRGREVVLIVSDSGVGFPPAEARRLFEKFYRVGDELRRTRRGSGLGLYLVRRFVELGGGSVEAMSEGPGRGAKFTVAWPAAQGGEA